MEGLTEGKKVPWPGNVGSLHPTLYVYRLNSWLKHILIVKIDSRKEKAGT